MNKKISIAILTLAAVALLYGQTVVSGGFIQIFGDFVEQADCGTPASGNWRVCAESTGLVVTDDAGTETVLGAGGSATQEHYEFIPACKNIGGLTSGGGWSAVSYTGPGFVQRGGGDGIKCAMEFDAAADEGIGYMWQLPPTWDGGTVSLTLNATGTSDTPAQVRMNISTQCIAAGESYTSTSFNTAQQLDIARGSSSSVLTASTLTPLTTTGCAAGEMLTFRFLREGATDTTNDTYVGHYELHSMVIKWSE